MSLDVVDVENKKQLTAHSVYSVRQSQETISSLQKENFNLKMKIYLIESKQRQSIASEVNETSDNEYMDLFMENESLRNDLEEKHHLMKFALNAIQQLEDQKLKIEKKCKDLQIEQQMTIFKDLKTKKPKSLRKKVPQIKFVPGLNDKFEQQIEMLRMENKKLIEENLRLEERLHEKDLEIELLENEKTSMQSKLDSREVERKLKVVDDMESPKQNLDPLAELKKENECLKETLNKLTEKCRRLERDSNDLERLLNEQSELMKALNRTIELKNEELVIAKNHFQLSQTSSTTSEIYVPEDIDLSNVGFDNSSIESSEFPFYNPLFGKHFDSLYR